MCHYYEKLAPHKSKICDGDQDEVLTHQKASLFECPNNAKRCGTQKHSVFFVAHQKRKRL